jgi:hypothetical protein
VGPAARKQFQRRAVVAAPDSGELRGGQLRRLVLLDQSRGRDQRPTDQGQPAQPEAAEAPTPPDAQSSPPPPGGPGASAGVRDTEYGEHSEGCEDQGRRRERPAPEDHGQERPAGTDQHDVQEVPGPPGSAKPAGRRMCQQRGRGDLRDRLEQAQNRQHQRCEEQRARQAQGRAAGTDAVVVLRGAAVERQQPGRRKLCRAHPDGDSPVVVRPAQPGSAQPPPDLSPPHGPERTPRPRTVSRTPSYLTHRQLQWMT